MAKISDQIHFLSSSKKLIEDSLSGGKIFVSLRSKTILKLFLQLFYQEFVNMNCNIVNSVDNNPLETAINLDSCLESQNCLDLSLVLFFIYSFLSSLFSNFCFLFFFSSFHPSFVLLLLPFFFDKTRTSVHRSSFPLLSFLSFPFLFPQVQTDKLPARCFAALHTFSTSGFFSDCPI